MTHVKICGLREVEHALAATEAGADLIGFIFHRPARRYVEPAVAKQIADAVRGRVQLVGVFVDGEPMRMAEIADQVGLDLIQLACDAPASRPTVRTVHVDAQTSLQAIAEQVRGAQLIHLDTKRDGHHGGTGQTFDWTIARAASSVGPVLLAGGLHPGNVAEAISTAAPWGVDVSSGVETDGRKDPSKIEAFIRAVKQC